MTDLEFQAWLKKGGRYVVLVEADTTPLRYLSTVAYTTLPSDTPANRVYSPVLAGGIALSETLPLDGTATLSAGDIEIHNEDGSLDSWLDDIWTNRRIQVFIGDVTWPRADFKLVFDGVAAGLESTSPERLNIVLRDKLQRLNTPVSETLLGGSTPNSTRLQPITLGEVHNIEPLLTNPALHEYQCHAGAIESIIEVRADGVPRTITTSGVPAGSFRLTASPEGTITASVQGRTPYVNTVSNIVQVLATAYGTPSERFTSSDLDTAQLNAFNTAHPQPVGIHISDRSNVLQCCQDLAASVGAQVAMSRTGLMRLLKIDLPASGTPVYVTESDYEADSLSISQRSEVIAGVRLGYCKNWTVQTTINSGIPSEHKDLYAQEYLTVTARDSTVASNYKLYADEPQVDTLLLKKTDAQAEANRRLALWKTQRTVYRFTGYAHLLTLELGQALNLTSPRFGLSSGKTGVVVGLQSDWISRRVVVEVLI